MVFVTFIAIFLEIAKGIRSSAISLINLENDKFVIIFDRTLTSFNFCQFRPLIWSYLFLEFFFNEKDCL